MCGKTCPCCPGQSRRGKVDQPVGRRSNYLPSLTRIAADLQAAKGPVDRIGIGRAYRHLVEIDRTSHAGRHLFPSPSVVSGGNEAEIAAPCRVATGKERIRVRGMRVEAHEILHRRDALGRAVRASKKQAVMRRDEQVRRVLRVNRQAVNVGVAGKIVDRHGVGVF